MTRNNLIWMEHRVQMGERLANRLESNQEKETQKTGQEEGQREGAAFQAYPGTTWEMN